MCGLKPPKERGRILWQEVTPFVGVWIETQAYCCRVNQIQVTPFVGVWIETCSGASPSSSGCAVTPFVGVWIETWLRFTMTRPWAVTPFVGVWIETTFSASMRLTL